MKGDNVGAQIQDKKQKKLSILYGLVCIGIMISFWIIPAPEGMKAEGWHLLGIFCATILAIILKVMPIGALSMIAIAIVAITCVTAPGDTKASIKNALSGFNESLIWMIGVAIMISRAIIKTGLGKRIGYYFVSLFGKNTLGIAYSLVVSETILAPVTPSNTARGGAIIHPIMRSIAHNFNSEPETKTQNKIGKYLALVNFQINPITSGMFITATAPNPMVVNKIVEVANNHGIEIDMHITWGQWALSMFLPSIVVLFLLPLVVWAIYPPEIKKTENAKDMATKELNAMGPMSLQEKVVLGIFAIMLALWAGVGKFFGFKIDPAAVAFLGLALTLVSGILTWEDILKEKSAWDTVVWFSALVMMASFLGKLGVVSYYATHLESGINALGFGWFGACLLLTLMYLYMHYFFASTTAHIAAVFAAFYAAGLALGAPPMLYALMLAAAGNIMMSLTHYATGTAPVIFGSGYASVGEWWKVGFVMSVVSVLVFGIVGGIWWKILGYY